MGSIQVGLIGTGYAARLRAEHFQADRRSQLVAVASRHYDQALELAQKYGVSAVATWQELIQSEQIDLVVIATTNDQHGTMVQAALDARKAVVVEYPLTLDVAQAQALIAQAQQQQTFLHIEHIELLGGLHQALLTHLPAVGTPFHVHYRTINPQHPAPRKWTYQPDQFGFPLMGALSRIHRLTHAFGPVATVSGQLRYDPAIAATSTTYTSCTCAAQLQFQSGLIAEVMYGKGEAFWQGARYLEVQGDEGALVFDHDQGRLINAQGEQPIAVGGRRGLFAQDTTLVLDALLEGKPLYVTPAESLYALSVADAVRRSAQTQSVIALEPIA